MDPILRRSLFFYVSTFVVFSGVLGRYLGRDAWPVFEAIPLMMPAYLVSAVMFSERGESYAFLRTLPVTDRRIVGTKLATITVSVALYWVFMTGIAAARMSTDVSSPATVVYVTVVCIAGLLLGAGCQIGIWRFGHSKMVGASLAVCGIILIFAITHTASLRRDPGWPVLTQVGPIEWMGRAPWLSVPALAALGALAVAWLVRLGVNVKERSETYL